METPSCCGGSVLPKWREPSPEAVVHDVGLKIMNSLTRKKDRFVTMDGSRLVKWYMCGPTVYAPSHMGHARTYLGFDIIRRILSSYFGYSPVLVMNVTDLDDKIIVRAGENGISCSELSSRFEAEFHEDMANLGVTPPDVLTRVTEYMDEIVSYIATIVEKGLAYESNGSVYFAVEAFEKTEGMAYCKLCPEQVDNAMLLAEGEGKLSQDFLSDKGSSRDFALWKKSKEGEPTWPSPWGDGRPGWHIECSAMASDVFTQLGCQKGGAMDIHSGGIDLKFPHHDNEMAQSEAHSSNPQWVNYFVHSGHLHIKGFKMSKSLKNFITIRQALEQNTARQIRLCFLLHKYNAPMDYGDNTMAHAMEREKFFQEFFHNVKAALRENPISKPQRWDERAKDLQMQILTAKTAVDDALKDDFDTPAAMAACAILVKHVNLYLETNPRVVGLLVRNAAAFVTDLFRTFGLIQDGAGSSALGFPASEGAGSAGREEVLSPVLDALMAFRSEVRDKARAGDTSGVLKNCDAFRDDALPPLGVRLEDKAGGASVWKLEDPRLLLKEKEQKEAEKRRKEEEKAAKKKASEIYRLPPVEFMKQLKIDDGDHSGSAKYIQFGDDGMPTHNHLGEELNKSQKKSAKKMFDNHKKKHEKYLKTIG